MKLRILASLAQRISVRFHMEGLTEPEARGYVEEQMKRVGRETPLFSEAAVKWAAQASRGIPRLLGSLCLASLVDAATRKDTRVEREHMERAWLEVSDA